MNSVKALMLLAVMGLAACQSNKAPLGPDGQPLPQAYTITKKEAEVLPQRVTDAVNSLRSTRGTAPLTLDPALSAASMSFSRDMSGQNRAWHWGSDGSSPFDRARRAGFMGKVAGENVSETYENDASTITAWMSDAETRDVLLNPSATMIGLGWYQEPSGKLWWTLMTGHY